MAEQIQVALIAVGGVVVGSILNAVVQFFVTRQMLRAERERLRDQLNGEFRLRMLERRTDRAIDIVAELVTISDPVINQEIDYATAIRLVHRVQLLLDRKNPLEGKLNDRINALGLALAEHTNSPDAGMVPERLRGASLMQVHGEVIDAMQAVVVATGSVAR